MATFSIKEAIGYGWQKTKEHFWFVVAVTLIDFIFGFSSRFHIDEDKFKAGFDPALFFSALMVFFVFLIVGIIVSIGFTKVFLKLYRGEKAYFADLFVYYSLFWKYLLGHILVSLIILAGFILLIVPGVIFALRYSMTLFLIVDKNIWPGAALKESAKLTYGYKWQLFWLGLALTGINFLGLLVFFVGLLVTIPISMFALVYVYHKLLTREQLVPVPTQPHQVEPKQDNTNLDFL